MTKSDFYTFSSSELLMHNPSLPLLHKTERMLVRRGTGGGGTPPTSGSLKPLANLPAGRQVESTGPPPLLNLSNLECESCCEPPEGGRRKPTPDLLELSSRYETLHRQTLTSLARTQSGPALPSRQVRPPEPPRPWSDTARLVPTKPRQLEPLVAPALGARLGAREHLVIPRQRGLTGLHLSCNYSATNNRTVLEPIAVSHNHQEEEEEEEEEDTTV